MADQLTRTARQVRNGNARSRVHKLVHARTTEAGRVYRAACMRLLHAAEGAILTTHRATCAECAEAAKPAAADLTAGHAAEVSHV